MPAKFNWHKLPPDMRFGSAPDEEVILYRGFAPHQLDSSRGMLSAAAARGDINSIDAVAKAAEEDDLEAFIGPISAHASHAVKHSDAVTPFVSATPDKEIAERYAQNENEMVATLSIRADRLTLVPLLRYEALVLGSISLEDIVKIEYPIKPEPSPKTTEPQYLIQPKIDPLGAAYPSLISPSDHPRVPLKLIMSQPAQPQPELHPDDWR